MTEIGWFPVAVALTAALIGAVTDVWKFRVYNAMTLPLFLTGLVYHTATQGLSGLTNSLVGGLFCVLVLILPYAMGLMGAGDVKLLAGVGAWLGLPGAIVVFVVSSLAAGIYATVLIVCRGKLGESWITLKLILFRFATMGLYFSKDDLVEEMVNRSDRRWRVIPYGAMIPVGVLGVIVWFCWIRP